MLVAPVEMTEKAKAPATVRGRYIGKRRKGEKQIPHTVRKRRDGFPSRIGAGGMTCGKRREAKAPV